ncbi:FHA domain-containing protein DDL [Acorus gramineus]|uniref:FHA domain-containing protein DDL n=1 Tax=Acorus gramineus TaxID=55184 RepID=A0AAV9A9G2_ACOGR|nr:FHA domain-containing protein DDL [Acorus gramineus]
MGPAAANRRSSPVRRRSDDRSSSPVPTRRRDSPRKERSPPPRERRTSRARSPRRSNRSPSPPRAKRPPEKPRAQSPRRARSASPPSSPSSPRTKRLREAERGDREGRRREREERSFKSSRRGRSRSPAEEHHRGERGRHGGSRSPRGGDALRGGRTRDEETRTSGPEQVRDDDSIAKMKAAEEALEAKKKEEPSFELSGKLAAETNRYRGVTLLFTEPPDARKPDVRWRLYVFKGGEVLNEPLYVHRQSCYLFGRERRVADIPTDHPSCSKQHAVIQFRFVEKEQPDGLMSKKQVRPYLMDLGSTNGTFINDNRLEPQRYYELMEKDTIKFGNSSREYVLLHENSA